MLRLKSIRFKNYCGYKDAFFDFTDGQDIKNLALFYGPNGTGKTSMLQAIQLLGNASLYVPRGVDDKTGYGDDLQFRKLTYHPDYDPSYESFEKARDTMEIEGIFLHDGQERKVIFNSGGLVLNELSSDNGQRDFTLFTDADSPMTTGKFQLHSKYKDKFLTIAQAIFTYPVILDKFVPSNHGFGFEEALKSTSIGEKLFGEQNKSDGYYTDVTITKKDGTKVHFRRFSGGERKIVTLLAQLCSPEWYDKYDVILIDMLEKEVYMTRHAPMIDSIRKEFADKQVFATTHSAILVGHDNYPGYVEKKYLYNTEDYIESR